MNFLTDCATSWVISRIKIFGLNEALDRWWLHHPDEYPYWNEKYHSQEPDPKKVEKVLEEVYRALKKLD